MWFQGNHYVSTDKAQEHLTKKMQKIIMLQAVVQALSMFSHISFFPSVERWKVMIMPSARTGAQRN